MKFILGEYFVMSIKICYNFICYTIFNVYRIRRSESESFFFDDFINFPFG